MCEDDNKTTILVVDDDSSTLEGIAELLEEAGYHAEVARTGSDALAVLAAGQIIPRLILLDLSMPDMDGWEVLGALRRMPKVEQIPVVLFTGLHDAQPPSQELKPCGYIEKPLRMADLLATLTRWCH